MALFLLNEDGNRKEEVCDCDARLITVYGYTIDRLSLAEGLAQFQQKNLASVEILANGSARSLKLKMCSELPEGAAH